MGLCVSEVSQKVIRIWAAVTSTGTVMAFDYEGDEFYTLKSITEHRLT